MIEGIDLDDPDVIDIGQEHIVRIMYKDENETEVAGVVLMHRHQKDPDTICQGYGDVGPGEWEIIVREPLTIHPSFVCADCKDHGIVSEGKWHPAGFADPHDRHVMPVWLRFAMMSFCDDMNEIEYVYERPIAEEGLITPRDMVMRNEWSRIIRWLENMIHARVSN